MRKIMVVVITVAQLAGCAAQRPKVWHKEGGTQEQFMRDKMSCHQYGMQSAQAHGLAGNMFVERWINAEGTKCMYGLGYQ